MTATMSPQSEQILQDLLLQAQPLEVPPKKLHKAERIAAERAERYRLMVLHAGKGRSGHSIKFGRAWCIACRHHIRGNKWRKHSRDCKAMRKLQKKLGVRRKVHYY